MSPSSSADASQVIAIDYELDIASVPRLRQDLESIPARGIGRLIIDLTACTYVDTAGIAELVVAYRRSLAEAFRFALVIPARLSRLFSIVGLDQIVAIFPTVASAASASMLAESASAGQPAPLAAQGVVRRVRR
jgi:anti-sigma B factor antagonist